MITTDLQAVSTLPLHTRKETAVGLAFDVLNGRRDSLELDQFLDIKNLKEDSNRIFKAISCDTAKDVREAVELMFGSSVFQRSYSKLRMVKNPLGGMSVMNVSL
jgi:hypothetical protein